MPCAISNVGWARAGGTGRGDSPPIPDSSSSDLRESSSDMMLETGTGLCAEVDVDGTNTKLKLKFKLKLNFKVEF